MIRDRNLSEVTGDLNVGLETIVLPISAGASASNVIQSGFRAAYAGKVVSAHVYAATMTDADDSIRADLKKNGTSVLPATIDPVTADTMTSLAPNATTFVAGDKFTAVILTGAGDAIVGQITLVIRPLLGHELL